MISGERACPRPRIGVILWDIVPPWGYRGYHRWLWRYFNWYGANPFGRGYFLNNQPTNSIYEICKLFSQELLEVFLPNSSVEIKKKKKYTQCIWVVLICFVSSQALPHQTFYWVVWPCGSAKAVGRQAVNGVSRFVQILVLKQLLIGHVV